MKIKINNNDRRVLAYIGKFYNNELDLDKLYEAAKKIYGGKEEAKWRLPKLDIFYRSDVGKKHCEAYFGYFDPKKKSVLIRETLFYIRGKNKGQININYGNTGNHSVMTEHGPTESSGEIVNTLREAKKYMQDKGFANDKELNKGKPFIEDIITFYDRHDRLPSRKEVEEMPKQGFDKGNEMKTYIIKYERTLYYEAKTEDEAREKARKEMNEEAAFNGLDIDNFKVAGVEKKPKQKVSNEISEGMER